MIRFKCQGCGRVLHGVYGKAGERKAFTLIELLVVISIIALLVSILVPSLVRVRQLTKRTQCKSNLHEIVKGCQIYAVSHSGRYPLGEEETSSNGIWFTDKYYLHGRLLEADIVKKQVFWCPSHDGGFSIDNENYGAQNIGKEGKTSKIPYFIRGIPQGGPARTGGENKSLLQDLEVRPKFTNHGTELYPIVNAGYTDGSAKGFAIPEENLKWNSGYVQFGGDEVDSDGNIIKTGTWTQFDRGETEPIPD